MIFVQNYLLKMKRLFLLFLLSLSTLGFSQQESRFGLIVGANQFYLDADFLSTKSATGYTFGVVATVPVHEYSELLAELTYNRFATELLGRKDALSSPEWIRFYAERINLSVLYDYNIFSFHDEDFSLGVCAGPTLSFVSDFNVSDDSKEDYVLDPYNMNKDVLLMDTYGEKVIGNLYGTFGITGRYFNWEGSLRYNLGLTDPFRKLSSDMEGISLKGNNNYLGFQITYFFGNYY